MNHSQRKHLERLMAEAPRDDFDPFGLGSLSILAGLRVTESPDRPRYEMPEWLVPPRPGFEGLRWDPKLRADTNRWAREFLGTTNVVPPGMVFRVANSMLVMNPRDILKLSTLV